VIARNTATATGWGGKPPIRRMKISKWLAHSSGAMHWFVAVELASGMVINDLRLIISRHCPCVSMSAQKQFDRDGDPRCDDNGKPIFSQIIEFKNYATQETFAAAVVEARRREHPDVFGGEVP
jgi:DNA-binding cell septation regulator SpoVG